MKEQLSLLSQLQEIDNQIDVHESDLTRLPAEIQEIARSLVTIRREIEEERTESTSVETELRKKEQELATEQDKIRRSEKRLLQIKNQKEYNALSREVKLGKKVVAELEEAILQFLERIEQLKRDLEKKEKQCADMDAALVEKKEEAEKTTESAQDALASLRTEKEKTAEHIEREFLKRYNTVKNVRGDAMAEVVEGICSACNMAVPPQMAIKVLKQEEIIVCPNCQRLLYVKPENIPEYNKIE